MNELVEVEAAPRAGGPYYTTASFRLVDKLFAWWRREVTQCSLVAQHRMRDERMGRNVQLVLQIFQTGEQYELAGVLKSI